MRLLFHCCCAPCTLSCLESINNTETKPDLYWYNPNIHPLIEYRLRRDALVSFAAKKNLELKLIDEYGLSFFITEVFPNMNDKAIRCERCYYMRLYKTAEAAAVMGYDAFSTSLLASPYQNHEKIKRIGEELGEKYNIQFYYKDFRPAFRQGQAEARAEGLYMQKYCGCIFSEEERFKS
jgi:predicted adenine nucleotide alpha hydrolase (AANH) superfamily ATPase